MTVILFFTQTAMPCIWVKFWKSVQLAVMLTEKLNRQILILIDTVLSRKCFPRAVTSNRLEIFSFFVIL